MSLPYARAAVRHLKKSDPVLAEVIERVGPCALETKGHDTFEALVQSIVYQQLNGKAAGTIHGRVLALFDGGRALTPERLLRTPDEALRAAGLSRNKLLAVKDLAEKCRSGVVLPRKRLEAMSDAEIVERLTEVRGVGEWTVHMFLMFRLGRPDVLPLGDYGVRTAFERLYGRRKSLERHGAVWAPYRTVASWYLWRSLDGEAAL